MVVRALEEVEECVERRADVDGNEEEKLKLHGEFHVFIYVVSF